MPSDKPTPSKRDVALDLLDRGYCFVHLDPRAPGVTVPAHLSDQVHLVLRLGYEVTPPIPDLTLDEAGWSGTLSFNRTPIHCEVPWGAVFALLDEDGLGMAWPDDLPPELAVSGPGEEPTPPAPVAPAKSKRRRPRAAPATAPVTTAGAAATGPDVEAEAPPPAPPPRRLAALPGTGTPGEPRVEEGTPRVPHLRLVK